MSVTLDQHFFLALIEIIWINILLSGDNAVAIALACRPLPPKQRRWGVILGSLGAITLRIIFSIFVVYLLEVPYLKVTGSILLLWIAIKLILPEEQADEGESKAAGTLFSAVRTVIIADAVMSLDNVIAIAAAAEDSMLLLIVGLLISMPLIVYGSTLVLKALERFPLLITAGGALLGWIAGEVLITDPVLVNTVEHDAPYLHDLYIAPFVGALFVVIVGLWLARTIEARRRQKLDVMS